MGKFTERQALRVVDSTTVGAVQLFWGDEVPESIRTDILAWCETASQRWPSGFSKFLVKSQRVDDLNIEQSPAQLVVDLLGVPFSYEHSSLRPMGRVVDGSPMCSRDGSASIVIVVAVFRRQRVEELMLAIEGFRDQKPASCTVVDRENPAMISFDERDVDRACVEELSAGVDFPLMIRPASNNGEAEVITQLVGLSVPLLAAAVYATNFAKTASEHHAKWAVESQGRLLQFLGGLVREVSAWRRPEVSVSTVVGDSALSFTFRKVRSPDESSMLGDLYRAVEEALLVLGAARRKLGPVREILYSFSPAAKRWTLHHVEMSDGRLFSEQASLSLAQMAGMNTSPGVVNRKG